VRNRRLRSGVGTHPEFYRAVMADDVKRRTAKGAVGTESEERWQAAGRKQFRFLRDHGLERNDFLLEIGCGNLRAGRRFIRYLKPGHYTGVDISPEILLAAQDTIVEYELQTKAPRLFLVSGTSLAFLAPQSYDVVHAHSVFTHTPMEVVTAYFEAAHRVLRPGGFFDFTYHHSDEGSWDVVEEDYYYPTELLLERAQEAGFAGQRLDNWTYSQAKIRLTKLK
jgi:cyclopropane fatty-acyl-phospholipid synthase-like methyltransferase